MNITDVGHLTSDADEGEDKMELGASREGKSAWDTAEFYTEAFFRDFDGLNCIRPHVVCEATKHIPEMIELVGKLEKNGCVYRISDGIYFDTSRFAGYSALAGQSHIDGIRSGARVEFSEEKKNATDFALWKFSPKDKKRQMEWDSPWGKGFPGWHIECSAMSMKYLGETFDIHCGGVDHIAIHHTNEIAQAEAATGKPFVKYWLHNEFLVMPDGGKMAKSSGGFLTLEAVREKGYDPLAYRYLCLGAHYRTQLEFSWESMDFAAKSLSTLRENIWNLTDSVVSGKMTAVSDPFRQRFVEAVEDDLNMPQALAVLWEALRNQSLKPEEKLGFAEYADRVLGFSLVSPRKIQALPDELMALVKERELARKNKDFKKSDELRKLLSDKGVIIKDTPQGTQWTKAGPDTSV